MGSLEYASTEETKREQMEKEHATPPPSYTVDKTSVQAQQCIGYIKYGALPCHFMDMPKKHISTPFLVKTHNIG